MKSKAHLKGHPLHPMLIPFPIAFFTGTVILDAIALANGSDLLPTMAIYAEAAGIGFALLAALPGLMDFLYTVPPKSSAKKRAATHGLINVTMVALFSAVLILRINDMLSLPAVLTLEAAGFMMMSIAGWMGGTLVYRNQIGVDVRYAGAGKWKEAYHGDPGSHGVEVGTADELKVNQMKLIHVGGRRIVICRTEQGYAAFDDHCTHRGGSLAGGAMICGTVQCPWHGSQFDVRNGSVKAGPAREAIKVYTLAESGQKLKLTLTG